MNKHAKRMLVVLLMGVMLLPILSGCNDKPTSEVSDPNLSDVAFNELANQVEDSSELPTWQGKQLKLKVWYASGNGDRRNEQADNDVVTKEIARITGITIDPETSFENNGELMDARLGKIVASADWPDVILNPERAGLQKMVDAGVVYELSDYYTKYCPNLISYYNKAGLGAGVKSERSDGKQYYFYYSPQNWALKYTDPELPAEKTTYEIAPSDPYPYVYVRDDILKMLYPHAKTQQEIEDMYLANGKFTKEEITDVTFNSTEEFIKFLYDVQALGIKEGNKEISAFYTSSGIDNWGLLTCLGGLFGYGGNGNNGASYFTYWDKESQQVEYMFKQPFFKDVMWQYTKLLIDGVASSEAMIDQQSEFNEKVRNGLYAVIYGYNTPDNDTLKRAGMPYQYRKVYLTIPQKEEKFLFAESTPMADFAAILNKNIKQEDLPQIMRFFDFCASKAGQKLAMWGPRTAGLFDEVDGKRTYKDAALEECMVYGVVNKEDVKYNLKATAWPPYPFFRTNKYNPKFEYEIKREPTNANRFFSLGIYDQPEMIPAVAPHIWEFDAYGIEGVQKFWRGRTTFEDSIFKIFVCSDRDEFEKVYQDMVDTATRLGLDDATLEEINKAYLEINKENMHELLK